MPAALSNVDLWPLFWRPYCGICQQRVSVNAQCWRFRTSPASFNRYSCGNLLLGIPDRPDASMNACRCSAAVRGKDVGSEDEPYSHVESASGNSRIGVEWLSSRLCLAHADSARTAAHPLQRPPSYCLGTISTRNVELRRRCLPSGRGCRCPHLAHGDESVVEHVRRGT